MDGPQVYSGVSQCETNLMMLLQWAEKDRSERAPASMLRDCQDYVGELKRLTTFLNQNTSNSLVFKKNTLNVIFKNNTTENVIMIHDLLRKIYNVQTRIEAIIATIAPKHQKTLSTDFIAADAALSKYIQDLETRMTKKGVEFIPLRNELERAESLQSVDFTNIHSFKESDLVAPAPRRKSLVFNFKPTTKIESPSGSNAEPTAVPEGVPSSSSPNRPN